MVESHSNRVYFFPVFEEMDDENFWIWNGSEKHRSFVRITPFTNLNAKNTTAGCYLPIPFRSKLLLCCLQIIASMETTE